MAENNGSPALARNLEDLWKLPEPDPAFLTGLRSRFIQGGKTRVQPRPQKKIWQTIRIPVPLGWGLAATLLLAAVILLFTSPTMVTAMQRLFGFIPGVGPVEQAPMPLVLATETQIERDGTTVWIREAAADSEHTTIVYEHDGTLMDMSACTPPDTYPPDRPALILPDGARLEVSIGQRMAFEGQGIRYALEFPPLPEDVTEVTLLLTRLAGMPPGCAPEDWLIPLELVPAPEGTVLPLNEAAQTGQDPAATAAWHGIVISLDSTVTLTDGVLLNGSLTWDAQDYPAYGIQPLMDFASVRAASGQELPFEPVYGPELPQNQAYRTYWAVKVSGSDLKPPLSVHFERLSAALHPHSFSFDPGSNPQIGQTWDLESSLPVAGSQVDFRKVKLIGLDDGSLAFRFTIGVNPEVVTDLSLSLPISRCSGGGGATPADVQEEIEVLAPTCQESLPPGPIEVQIDQAVLRGNWQVNW